MGFAPIKHILREDWVLHMIFLAGGGASRHKSMKPSYVGYSDQETQKNPRDQSVLMLLKEKLQKKKEKR